MAIQPFAPFPTAEPFNAFDFSPLAKLGQQQQDQRLANLAQTSGSPPPPGSLPAGAPAGYTSAGGTSAPSSEPYMGDRSNVARSVVSELRSQGFSDNAISGILYNIGHESNFNPNLRHPDQPNFGGEAHYAHGLYQEGGDEYNTMAAHLAKRGANWQDPIEQTRFVAGRLKGEIGNDQYSDVYRRLQAARTPEEAARVFASGYLKPRSDYLNQRISMINNGIPTLKFYIGGD